MNLAPLHTASVCSALFALLSAGALLPAAATAQQEDAKEVLAVRVREQNHPCNTPVKAERDAARSKAHDAVWHLRCDNADYRLRLRMDMGAEITRLN
jgi:hypothetical protein